MIFWTTALIVALGLLQAHPSTRFADVNTITPANVSTLKRAWVFHTGELAGGEGPNPKRQVAAFQTRPVFLDGTLYLTTPTSRVIALDADTGQQRWAFDPQSGKPRKCEQPHRGVVIWQTTIFSGTCDGRLIALDAATGRPRIEFGADGSIDLRPGVDARAGEEYSVTSAAAVYRDLVIVGAAAPEGTPRGPAGDIRAFDARTGKLAWTFHTVPRPGELGHDTWPADGWQRRTGVNVWSQMTVDHDRGLVFAPIGSASYDFYGGDRAGNNLFSSSIVALDAATGKRVWHQQLVHHDLWDYDPPAPPILVDLRMPNRVVPAVVQLTKMGLVFVFDRTTGAPVFGLEERRVAASTVPGEKTSRTQPFPVKPPPLARIEALRRDELTQVTPESRRECEAIFDRVKSGGIYTPASLEDTLWFPGTMGGVTWSGGAVDPRTGWLFVNTNEIGALGRMEKQKEGDAVAYRRRSQWGEYARFWDSNRLPCQRPPWGRLHAVNLTTGAIVWQVPFGDAPQLDAQGITGTGTPNLGGAIVTESGLVFIAATNDRRIRAYDAASGRVLWQETLDAAGHATPVAYRSPKSGRDFVVIAAGGGGRFSTTVSDTVIAFALPGASNTQEAQPAWPPAGVVRQDASVRPPALISEVKPQYTEAAMRARIQGSVVIQAVVEADGSVGPTRVVTSLDKESGLDDAAIAAVKQWRFKPATRNGVPVRILITTDLTFSLRGLPPPVPPLTLPRGFMTSDGPAKTGWSDDSVDYAELRFRLAYPRDWMAGRSMGRGRILELMSEDGTLMVTLGSAGGIKFFPTEPVSQGRLRELAEVMKSASVRGTYETVDVGQVQLGGRLWLWHEARVRDADLSSAPPEMAAQIKGRVGSVTTWSFFSAVPPQSVVVMFVVIHPRDIPDAAIAEQRQSAAATFAAILQRLSIEKR